MVVAFDIGATLLFAVEGAILGVAADFDLLGVLVVAFATALGGGIIRDVLLGGELPAALQLKRYAITAFVGGSVVFLLASEVRDIDPTTLVALDAAGLAAFAVAGAAKALDFNTNALTAVLLGGVTAVGGGVVRDILLNRVPVILVADFYATAALIGAAIMVAGVRIGNRPVLWMMWIGAVACFVLRMVGYQQHWSLAQF